MNRLLFCEPWPVSNYSVSLDQFLDGIISLFITLQIFDRRASLLVAFALGGGLFGRSLLGFRLDARFCRGLFGNRLLRGGLFLHGLRRLVVAVVHWGPHRRLLALRARADGRLVVVG